MIPRTILMAEDDPNDIELTMLALEKQTLAQDVVVTRNGAEALNFLYRQGKYADREQGAPILILLDLKMPKVDGLEVLRTIKSDPNLKTIPVVILTSSNDEQDVIDSYESGANAYLVKPVAFHQFVNVVQQIGQFWTVLNHYPQR